MGYLFPLQFACHAHLRLDAALISIRHGAFSLILVRERSWWQTFLMPGNLVRPVTIQGAVVEVVWIYKHLT